MGVLDRRSLLSVGRIGVIGRPYMGTTFGVEIRKEGERTEWWVTAAHVIEAMDSKEIPMITGKEKSKDQLPKKAQCYKFTGGPNMWTVHPERVRPENEGWNMHSDVAVAPLARDLVTKSDGTWKCFSGDWLLSRKDLEELGIWEGCNGYMIGFPGGQIEPTEPLAWSWPTVRTAMIAQIQPWYDGQTRVMLVESMGSEGNSGGPIITAPEMYPINGPRADRSVLIGLVSGSKLSRKYQEVGLSIVIPWQEIETTIESAMSQM